MSALMLLLVQTCCHGIAKEAGKITQAKADVPVDAADRDVRMGELLAMVSCPALSCIIIAVLIRPSRRSRRCTKAPSSRHPNQRMPWLRSSSTSAFIVLLEFVVNAFSQVCGGERRARHSRG
jgi:hypothetical protein